MALPKYVFKGAAKGVVEDAIISNNSDENGNFLGFIGDFEAESDSIYFNKGDGQDSVKFYINQDTGIVEIELGNPNSNRNYWAGIFSEDVRDKLQELVVKSAASGGKRKNKSKTRKNKK